MAQGGKTRNEFLENFPSIGDDILINKFIRNSHQKGKIPQYLVLNFVPA